MVAKNISNILVSTTFDVPGKRIVRFLGPVFGITVRTRAIGPDVLAALRGLVGGEVAGYTKLAHQARFEALERMKEEAKKQGANAVVGVRFDSGPFGTGNIEIFAYGTAVVVA